VVECDRCGEGEEACADSRSEAGEGAGAVAFEGEQVFAGLEDRFDPLADWDEVSKPGLSLANTAINASIVSLSRCRRLR